MSVKEWLKSFKHLNIEIGSIKDELDYFEKHKSPCVMFRVLELQARYDLMLKQKIILSEVVDRIADPVARTIYRGRYITNEKWETIGKKCGGMCVRNAHLIHDHSLPEVEKLYKEVVEHYESTRNIDKTHNRVSPN